MQEHWISLEKSRHHVGKDVKETNSEREQRLRLSPGDSEYNANWVLLTLRAPCPLNRLGGQAFTAQYAFMIFVINLIACVREDGVRVLFYYCEKADSIH